MASDKVRASGGGFRVALSYLSYRLLDPSFTSRCFLPAMPEPSSKKRRIDSNVPAKQDSFSEILQQLEAEGDMSGGERKPTAAFSVAHSTDHIETSAAWPRPTLVAIEAKKQSIGELWYLDHDVQFPDPSFSAN